MTEARQRAMRIISLMPEAEVERFVNLNISLEPEYIITSSLQNRIDNDIDNTQRAIDEGCEMLSVEESYRKLRDKYAF